jgi:hypothetical protein
MGGTPVSLKPMLTYIADVLGLSYAELTGGSGGQVAQAAEPGEPKASSDTAGQAAAPQATAEPVQPRQEPAPAAASPSQPAAEEPKSAAAAETPAAPATPAPSSSPSGPGGDAGGGGGQPAVTAEAPPAPAAPSAAAQPAAPQAAAPQPSVDVADRAAPQSGGGEAQPAAAPARAKGALGAEECRQIGVLSGCQDLNAVLDQLLEKPVEYNHPEQMLLGRKSEIALVLRTDWEGKDLPTEVSKEFKDLPGEVKQGLSKVTQIMSAELTGRDFEIDPSGRQERTVVPPQPVSWNWQVTPTETGGSKPLKLRLYAHVQGPQGPMPPILIKTLDATINVDVTTWDWLVNQARILEPVYAVLAAVIGLLTAFFTFVLARRRREATQAGALPGEGGYLDKLIGRRRGPVIGDLDQSSSDSRPPAPPTADDDKKEKGPDGGTSV